MKTNASQIVEHTIESQSLNESLTVMVYLPENYSPLYTYPVVITQDGQDYFKLGRITSTADRLIKENEIDDVIIVLIPYKNVRVRWQRYHPDGESHQAYQRFLIYELLPFISDHYSIHPLATGRTLMGESLGGTVSLLTAMNYPYSIGQVIMQSPYINQEMIHTMETFNHASMLSIYHVIGLKETAVKTTKGKLEDFLEPNRSIHAKMRTMPFSNYVYDELAGDHTWKTWQPDIQKALKTLLKKGILS